MERRLRCGATVQIAALVKDEKRQKKEHRSRTVPESTAVPPEKRRVQAKIQKMSQVATASANPFGLDFTSFLQTMPAATMTAEPASAPPPSSTASTMTTTASTTEPEDEAAAALDVRAAAAAHWSNWGDKQRATTALTAATSSGPSNPLPKASTSKSSSAAPSAASSLWRPKPKAKSTISWSTLKAKSNPTKTPVAATTTPAATLVPTPTSLLTSTLGSACASTTPAQTLAAAVQPPATVASVIKVESVSDRPPIPTATLEARAAEKGESAAPALPFGLPLLVDSATPGAKRPADTRTVVASVEPETPGEKHATAATVMRSLAPIPVSAPAAPATSNQPDLAGLPVRPFLAALPDEVTAQMDLICASDSHKIESPLPMDAQDETVILDDVESADDVLNDALARLHEQEAFIARLMTLLSTEFPRCCARVLVALNKTPARLQQSTTASPVSRATGQRQSALTVRRAISKPAHRCLPVSALASQPNQTH